MTSTVSKTELYELLSKFTSPWLPIALTPEKHIQAVVIGDPLITIDILLHYHLPDPPLLAQQLAAFVVTQFPHQQCHVNIHTKIIPHSVQQGVKALPGIKNIIAVASGKGGVGKSTTAVNLAVALRQCGASVGLLDADIYGPSVPMMLGITKAKPESLDGTHLEPIMAHGLQTISIGNLVDDKQAVIWRGPMVTSVLQQLFNDTRWQDLDYLIVDLPPGTGDIQLTMAQKIPLAGVVVVTTPQDIALLDVKRAVAMFNKVSVPVLGVIENMSVHICSQCGHHEAIFGDKGARELCETFNLPLLGKLPLAMAIRQQADLGEPIVLSDNHYCEAYQKVAIAMAAQLSTRAKNYAATFPKIVVENR